MSITERVPLSNWEEFLQTNNASVYHTPGWRDFLEKTFRYKTHYLFFEDDASGKVSGMLPLAAVRSRLFPLRLTCLPFAHYCPVVGSNVVMRALTNQAIKTMEETGARALEIRGPVPVNGFEGSFIFSTYMLSLDNDAEHMRVRLRRALRSSLNYKLEVEYSTSRKDLWEFYQLNCIIKREHGVPSHPWNFLSNLVEILAEKIWFIIAKEGNELAGGAIFITHKDQILYGYGAANPSLVSLHPYDAVLSRAILDGCREGYRFFDFGSVADTDVGLVNFKRKWGGVRVPLSYSHYPRGTKTPMASAYSGGLPFRFANSLVRWMPMPLYQKLSARIFGGLG